MFHVPAKDNNLNVIQLMLQNMKIKFKQDMHGVSEKKCPVKREKIITAQLFIYPEPISIPTCTT